MAGSAGNRGERSRVRGGQAQGVARRARRGVARPAQGPRPISVVVAEDSYLIREALRTLLEGEPAVEVAAVCADTGELERALAERRPDVLVTGIRLPAPGTGGPLDGEGSPPVGVVAIGQEVDAAWAIELMRSGTSGRAYLLRDRVRDEDELLAAIRAVAEGGSVIDPLVIDALVEDRAAGGRSPLAVLTPRELEILGEIAAGKSNAAIASSLALSRRAVEKHINSIFAKLDLPEPRQASRRVTAAVMFLAEAGRRPRPVGG